MSVNKTPWVTVCNVCVIHCVSYYYILLCVGTQSGRYSQNNFISLFSNYRVYIFDISLLIIIANACSILVPFVWMCPEKTFENVKKKWISFLKCFCKNNWNYSDIAFSWIIYTSVSISCNTITPTRVLLHCYCWSPQNIFS